MSLSSIIGRVVELCDVSGTIDTHKAVQTALPLVMADEEAAGQLIREALIKRIKDAATSLRRKAFDAPAQSSFFGDHLRRRYALDIEGRVIKDTEYLTRLEFERLIAIREKQLADDATHLDVLRQARTALAPIWDVHPNYTYGEAERVFLQAVVEAA